MIKRTDRNLRIMLLFCDDWNGGPNGKLYRASCRIRRYMRARHPKALGMYARFAFSTINGYRKSELYKRLEDSCLSATGNDKKHG